MAFIGRHTELTSLQRFFNHPTSNLSVVYGRRRVGKSALLKEAVTLSGVRWLYMECKKTSETNNLEQLMALACAKLDIPPIAVDTIEGLLDFLFKFCQHEPMVLVLDEYPFLRDLIQGADSILQALVDRYKGTSKLKIILCGSYIDVMKGILEYKSPLYGRADVILHMMPMSYFDIAQFHPRFSFEDKVRLYAIFGGMPYYNALVDDQLTLKENVIELLIKVGAKLTDEIELFLTAELSKINDANLVLEALGLGKKKFSDIASHTKLTNAALSKTLSQLMAMDIVVRDTPINDSGNARKSNYVICDNMVLFYYRYIYRNISKARVMDERTFYDAFIHHDLESQYVPHVFEEIAKQFLIRMNKAGRIEPPFFNIGRYVYDLPKEKRNGEFDVVTEDSQGFCFYECKYKNHPINKADVEEEIAQVKASPLSSHRFGFISKSGFKDVTPTEHLRLWTLQDLYHD